MDKHGTSSSLHTLSNPFGEKVDNCVSSSLHTLSNLFGEKVDKGVTSNFNLRCPFKFQPSVLVPFQVRIIPLYKGE